jgi:hypothetical protein
MVISGISGVRLFLWLTWGALMSGCMIIPPEMLPAELLVQVYRGGKVEQECTINSSSNFYVAIKKWYGNSLETWMPDFSTYAPSLVLRGDDFVLNFAAQGSVVVLNFSKASGRSIQLSKPLDAKGEELAKQDPCVKAVRPRDNG